MPARRKVKCFSESKGYGFVAKEDSGKILEHFSESARTGRKFLQEGKNITFDSFTGPQGPNAPHIVKLAKSPVKKKICERL